AEQGEGRAKPRRVRTLGYDQAKRRSKPVRAPDVEEPAHTAEAEALLGAQLGDRYRVDAVLGHGGMATVFQCRDEQLDRDVAVKVIHDAIAEDDELRGRFEREAKVLAALSHPHIVSLLDFGVQNGLPYLVMELLPGRSLGDLLEDGHRLPWERAVRLVTQLVGALAYAHAKGFLHRDLKPDNVFLT
ncbi:serine/threonine protein kinase, partial [bacterium]|nr:serine/threonine protein kinase [bacterium]